MKFPLNALFLIVSALSFANVAKAEPLQAPAVRIANIGPELLSTMSSQGRAMLAKLAQSNDAVFKSLNALEQLANRQDVKESVARVNAITGGKAIIECGYGSLVRYEYCSFQTNVSGAYEYEEAIFYPSDLSDALASLRDFEKGVKDFKAQIEAGKKRVERSKELSELFSNVRKVSATQNERI